MLVTVPFPWVAVCSSSPRGARLLVRQGWSGGVSKEERGGWGDAPEAAFPTGTLNFSLSAGRVEGGYQGVQVLASGSMGIVDHRLYVPVPGRRAHPPGSPGHSRLTDILETITVWLLSCLLFIFKFTLYVFSVLALQRTWRQSATIYSLLLP